MKNLSLFIILISLLSFTYFYEEIFKNNKKNSSQKHVSAFKNLDILKSLKTRNFEIEIGESIEVKNLDFPASKRLLQDFLKILSGIRIVKEVPINEKERYFIKNSSPLTLKLDNTNHLYQLGDVISLTGKFYLSHRVDGVEKLYLCVDDSYFSQNYRSDLDLALKKYSRLQKILEGGEDLFIERRLFQVFKLMPTSKVKIDSQRNRWFELNLETNTTEPQTFSEIQPLNLSETLLPLLSRVQIKKIVQQKKNILTNLSSEILLKNKTDNLSFKLYKGLNGNYGYFVKVTNFNYVLEIEPESADIFFSHVQEFWDKSFNLKLESKEALSFSISLSGEKYYSFRVEDLEKFIYKAISKEVNEINREKLNVIFNLLFNLSDFKNPKYLEKVQDVNKKDANLFYIKLLGKEFQVNLNGRKLEVVELNTLIKYVFIISNSQLTRNYFEDIFTLKRN